MYDWGKFIASKCVYFIFTCVYNDYSTLSSISSLSLFFQFHQTFNEQLWQDTE